MMIHQPNSWLKKVFEQQNGIQTNEVIESKILVEEILLMGLRLKEGINIKNFEQLIGQKFSEIFDQKKLAKLLNKSLLIKDDQRLVIPQNNWLVIDQIIANLCFAILT